ncbi:DUF3325 domain-containing protein [Shewanella sp. VB17]|uniref:DUF3325 domain-containing protein n=1 Tax=Shewanella sp. VB17 TaxID=2739432 RepID=UPI0015649D0A|nr:DUF3325 domain-containing protein [Shewanella sp. VB17]NRD74851.1 DUF3325 domain-containing protein [Shewanella sp. VB17]
MIISNSVVLSLLSFSYLALGCMALAMFSHFRDSFKRSPTQIISRGLHWLGWAILTISYGIAINNQGVSYGSIMFTGIISLAGLLVILTATYLPRYLPYFMTGLTSLGLTLMFIN